MGFFSSIGKAVKKVASSVTGGDLLSFGSSLLGGGLGYIGQQDTNSANIAQAREQMAFQAAQNAKQMDFQQFNSNTSYQRAVEDMKRAGLNPMLGYSQGGASVPTGATSAGAKADIGNSLGAGVSTALALKNAEANIENTQADTELKRATTENTQTTTGRGKIQLDIEAANKIDQIFTNTKIRDAERGEAITAALRASNDYNTINYLNEYSQKNGFRNFDEGMKSIEFRREFQNNLLQSNLLPKSEAEAGFYTTDFGRKIAPYMGSAEAASRIFDRFTPSLRR